MKKFFALAILSATMFASAVVMSAEKGSSASNQGGNGSSNVAQEVSKNDGVIAKFSALMSSSAGFAYDHKYMIGGVTIGTFLAAYLMYKTCPWFYKLIHGQEPTKKIVLPASVANRTY